MLVCLAIVITCKKIVFLLKACRLIIKKHVSAVRKLAVVKANNVLLMTLYDNICLKQLSKNKKMQCNNNAEHKNLMR